MSAEAERLFYRLLVVADDYGRFAAENCMILAKCFPLKVGKLQPDDIEPWLNELESAGLTLLYTVGLYRYGIIAKWGKLRYYAVSKLPEPPEDICAKLPKVSENSNTGLGLGLGFGLGLGKGDTVVRRKRLPDTEFLETLRVDPTYSGIDIDKELGKCRAWLTAKTPGAIVSQQRFINWLNRVERPMGGFKPNAPRKGLFIR